MVKPVLVSLFLGLTLVLEPLVAIDSPCPSGETFAPCKCEGWSLDAVLPVNWQISCKSVETQQIRDVFARAAQMENITKTYDVLKLDSIASLEMTDELIADFTFKVIKISHSNISRMDSLASTANITEELDLASIKFISESLLSGESLFPFIKSFPNLRSLSIRATNLEAIPSDAFSVPEGCPEQSKLTILRFGGNAIREVGRRAFYSLSNVTWLDIGNNQLEKVTGESLAFRDSSEKPIQVDLDFNRLDSESFDKTTFSLLKRPAILFLRRNNITYLREDVFAPLVKSTLVRLFPSGNPIECYNCKNWWVLQLKGTQAKDNLNEILCHENGKTIWDSDGESIKFCSIKKRQLIEGFKGLTLFLKNLAVIEEPHARHIMDLLDSD